MNNKRTRQIWAVSGVGYDVEVFEHQDHHIEITMDNCEGQGSIHMSMEEAVDLFNGLIGQALTELYRVRKSEGQI